ncbi:MAG: hypothetical protein M5U28_00460 [Sandaracinaceae bacterium]|nr:hypothetical protein [Sandaracinaceae bacterium]
MIEIDWGDLHPPLDVRAAAEARVRRLPLARERVVVRRRGSGYEAHVRTTVAGGSTMLRLHGEDLRDVVDRVTDLLSIVASESARQHQVLAAAG